jgi:histidine triad (HIT) family protein
MATIFSKIISGEIPCHKIAENEKFLAFLDISPLREGHTLVIPKNEVNYLFDVDDSALNEILLFCKPIAKKIEKVISCKRIGVSVIGLEVPHAHIHLVPIDSADDLNFTRPKLQLTNERLIELAEKIRNA